MTDPVIDLSHWNDPVDFEKIKAAGVIGVIHKCTESDDYTDPTYAERRKEAEAAGLLWGAYHFLRPGDMQAQAEHFVAHVGDGDDILLAADHEDDGVSLIDLKVFLDAVVTLTGRMPILYSGNVIKEQLGNSHDSELAQYKLWIAHYTSADAPSWPDHTWPTYWLWQYTQTGELNGVAGAVDLNRFVSDDLDELRETWSGAAEPPAPIPPEPEPLTITITIKAPPGTVVNVNCD